MTRSKIAKILGINKYEVKRIELQAIMKLQLAVGMVVDSRLLHRRRKRCGQCGEYGHQKQTCNTRVRQIIGIVNPESGL